MEMDPTTTDPDAYRVLFENDRVRVLEYHDTPGYRTKPHSHPDSVMYTLASFSRRLGGLAGRQSVHSSAVRSKVRRAAAASRRPRPHEEAMSTGLPRSFSSIPSTRR